MGTAGAGGISNTRSMGAGFVEKGGPAVCDVPAVAPVADAAVVAVVGVAGVTVVAAGGACARGGSDRIAVTLVTPAGWGVDVRSQETGMGRDGRGGMGGTTRVAGVVGDEWLSAGCGCSSGGGGCG